MSSIKFSHYLDGKVGGLNSPYSKPFLPFPIFQGSRQIFTKIKTILKAIEDLLQLENFQCCLLKNSEICPKAP